MLKVISFGYLHGTPPAGAFAADLRECLRDPHIDPALRQMTGLDDPIRQKVFNTNGAREVIDGLANLASDLHDRGIPLAVGCAGGRHRSVVVAEEVAAWLRDDGYEVVVEHRDIHRPVVQRTEAQP